MWYNTKCNERRHNLMKIIRFTQYLLQIAMNVDITYYFTNVDITLERRHNSYNTHMHNQ